MNTTTFAARDFWPRRGASDAHTLPGSVRSEQRRLGQKEPPPGGLRRFSVLASLLLGHSPTTGDAPSSRLARTENRRNKRGHIYEMGYLVAERQVLDDPVDVGGIHDGHFAQATTAFRTFGGQQMTFAGVRAQYFATGRYFEPLGHRFLRFDAFGTTHNFLPRRARNIKQPQSEASAFSGPDQNPVK